MKTKCRQQQTDELYNSKYVKHGRIAVSFPPEVFKLIDYVIPLNQRVLILKRLIDFVGPETASDKLSICEIDKR